VQVLKEEFKNQPEKLGRLMQLLEAFKSHVVAGEDCAEKVNALEAFLNGCEAENAAQQ
jgi:hypothetical protein